MILLWELHLLLCLLVLVAALSVLGLLGLLWGLESVRVWCGYKPARTYTAWDFFGPRK